MMKTNFEVAKTFSASSITRIISAIAALMLAANLLAADGAANEQQYIDVLKSDAAPGDKGIACKKLAIYGSEKAVSALAPLLGDESLSSWARIPLEAIPGDAASAALREAAGKLKGRLLVGVLNSIGVRGDAKAVDVVASKLSDDDSGVVAAAAVALGRIGGTQAAEALTRAFSKGSPAARALMADGCIRCAEKFAANGQTAQAVQLYDLVRKADVPRQKMMEATRGVIMAKKQDGIPMLIELLRSKDQDLHGLGLRVSRELPGPAVTKELIAEMRHSNEARQYLLVLALSDRGDESAFPVFMEMARGGFDNTRLAAISALEKSGKVAAVPALLEAAATGSPAVSQAALNSLARLGGDEVDADLRDRLPKTSGKTKRALIQVAGLRYISGTLPEIAASLEDSDPAVRTAAVSTLGAIGEEKQVAQLIQLLGKSGVDRSEVESALLAISGRKGSGCMPELIALSKNPDPALRVIGLHALASAGGKEALAALRAATEDKDETVQDEAVRTLSSWPNTWPEDEAVAEPLLALAKSARKTSYQVLAIRGYLQFLQGDKQLKGDEKVERVNQVLPAVKRPEEMRLVIGALGQIPCASGFALLQKLAADSAVSDDAYSALVSAAARNAPGVSKEDRRKALQTVVDKSANDATKKRAEEALKKVQ